MISVPQLQRVVVMVVCVAFLSMAAAPAFAYRGGRGRGGRAHHSRHHVHHVHHVHHRHHVHLGVWRAPVFWHPVGFFVTTMAVTAIVVSVADSNEKYYYDNGTYYQEGTDETGQTGYSVVPAPIGASVPTLPEGNETTSIGDKDYYYYAGTFYFPDTDGEHYVVVQAPVGALISYLPDGYKEVNKNDILYYKYQGIFYQPESVGGEVKYKVVPAP